MKSYDVIKKVGQSIIPGFEIDDKLKDLYLKLYAYFTKQDTDLDLRKGLLITGSIGSGKTTAIQVFRKMFRFGIVSTRYIIREFSKNGMDVIDLYGRYCYSDDGGTNYTKSPHTYCFDDLGMEETNSQLYGNKANVMGEILLDRYDCFVKDGMITHATTNLLISDLEKIYGDRIRDRLKQMMNLIIFDGKSLRK